MNILIWLITGGLAGWLATVLLNVDSQYGILGNIIIGIIGAFIGGFIADKVNINPGGKGADRPSTLWAFIWAVIGAVVLLFILSLF